MHTGDKEAGYLIDFGLELWLAVLQNANAMTTELMGLFANWVQLLKPGFTGGLRTSAANRVPFGGSSSSGAEGGLNMAMQILESYVLLGKDALMQV